MLYLYHHLISFPMYRSQPLNLIRRLGTARLSLRLLLATKSDPKPVLQFVRKTGRFPRYLLWRSQPCLPPCLSFFFFFPFFSSLTYSHITLRKHLIHRPRSTFLVIPSLPTPPYLATLPRILLQTRSNTSMYYV